MPARWKKAQERKAAQTPVTFPEASVNELYAPWEGPNEIEAGEPEGEPQEIDLSTLEGLSHDEIEKHLLEHGYHYYPGRGWRLKPPVRKAVREGRKTVNVGPNPRRPRNRPVDPVTNPIASIQNSGHDLKPNAQLDRKAMANSRGLRLRSDPKAIFAMDPGGTTGLVLLTFHHPKFGPPKLEYFQFDTRRIGALDSEFVYLCNTIRLHYAQCEFICESFFNRPDLPMGQSGADGLSPVAVIAGVQAHLDVVRDSPRFNPKSGEWIMQQPGFAKSSFPNPRLKELFPLVYKETAGIPHARDAARHLLARVKGNYPNLYEMLKRHYGPLPTS